MAVSNVNFQTGVNFQEGKQILSPLITEIADMVEAEVGLGDEAAKFGFTVGKVSTPDGVITSMVWPEYLPEINEDGETPLLVLTQGYDKGYQMKTYGGRIKVTKLFLEWLKTASTLQGADSSVKSELNKFKDGIIRLMRSSKRTINRELTNVLAKGFSVTAAYWPGSAGGDGVSLFNAAHPVKSEPGVTYSNLRAAALSAAELEAAIQAYKTTVKAPSGFRIDTPDTFTLLVPRALETTARKILNSSGDQAGLWAGTGSNANLLNVFSFQGSKVELVVLDMLGETDKAGGKIGGANADNMWFLLNKSYALEYGAFRIFTLWSDEIETWYDNNTKSTFTDLTCHWGVDFYNPEAIMWFPGA